MDIVEKVTYYSTVTQLEGPVGIATLKVNQMEDFIHCVMDPNNPHISEMETSLNWEESLFNMLSTDKGLNQKAFMTESRLWKMSGQEV